MFTPITFMTPMVPILKRPIITTTYAQTRSVHPTHSANQIAAQVHTAMVLDITLTIITEATTMLE